MNDFAFEEKMWFVTVQSQAKFDKTGDCVHAAFLEVGSE